MLREPTAPITAGIQGGSATATALPRPASAAAARPGRRILLPRPGWRACDWHLLGVLLLTAVAGLLRFSALDRPPLWGDESLVYWRTCSTYQELLSILRNDGFAPLHYELYWVIRQFVPLTAKVMRIVPALSATLMVPAMYFLGRQLVSRQAALLAAALTAVSGCLAAYGRDAKMYMDFWLMATLNVACLLWWLRDGRRLAWWGWIAAGLAMVGLHSLGFAVLAFQPLLLLTGRGLRWPRALACVLGVAVIVAGPAGYYLGFNHWTQNIQEQGWQASGIDWIARINGDATGAELARRAAVEYLIVSWPGWLAGRLPMPWLEPYLEPVLSQVPAGLAWLAVAGLFPWPTRQRGRAWAQARAMAGRMAVSGEGGQDMPQAWWRSYLCVASWALLPIYAFYCATFDDYAWPMQILRDLMDALLRPVGGWNAGWAMPLAAVVALAAFYCCGASWRERLVRLAQAAVVSALLFGAATVIAVAFAAWRPPGPLWTSRYSGFVWPALAIGVCTLLLRLPLAALRWGAIGLLLLANLAHSTARFRWRLDAPIELLTRDVLACQADNSAVRTFCLGQLQARSVLESLDGRYCLFSMSGVAVGPQEYRWGYLDNYFRFYDAWSAAEIVTSLKTAPAVGTVIVWDQYEAGPPRGTAASAGSASAASPSPATPDDLLPQLPRGWRHAESRLYPFYQRGGYWQYLGTWRRREYTQTGPGRPILLGDHEQGR